MNVGNDAIEFATGVTKSAVWNHMRLRLFAGFLASLLVAINLSWGGTATENGSATPSRANWAKLYANLPMSFELNRGQADGAVKYLARGQGYTLYLTGGEAVLSLNASPSGSTASSVRVLRLQLAGAKAAAVEGEGALPGESNYFVGNDPSRWQTHIPTYAKVRYGGVYRGVDVVYYGRQGQLENDFEVAAGADARQIELRVDGAEGLEVDGAGDLVLKVGGEEVRFHRPVAYQGSGESRRQVEARYQVRGRNRVGFAVGGYDRGQALVIDPVLSYATYLGGTGGDVAYGIAVDASGNAYVTGITNSTGFPTLNAAQRTYAGSGDAFVAKLNATGTALVYSTFLGGAGSDAATAIAVDASGDAFVTGSTNSANFPTTVNAFQTGFGGGDFDAFITQLDSTGSHLVYSSYLGGSGADFGQGVAVDTTGNAYVTGSTQSGDFTLVNPIQNVNKGGSDVFVAKVTFDGTALTYSTYLGGTGADVGQSIKVDSSGNAYVAGYTFSTDFPTVNPIQSVNFGRVDAFVAEVNSAGSALTFSSYLGGGGDDKAFGIALDSSKNIYVTGATQSADFPTTSTGYQLINHGQGDAFVCKLGPAGAGIIYSTLLGGSGVDQGNSIAVDSSGDAFVAGTTQSSDFPEANPLQVILGISGGGSCGAGTCSDAFVTELNPNGSGLMYSTYLGGANAEFGQGIALDTLGLPYVTGSTSSANFPVTVGVYEGALAGVAGNAFIAKIDPSNAPGFSMVPSKVNFGNQTLGVRSSSQTVTVINAGTSPLSITDITSSSADFAQTNNCIGTVAPGSGTCTLNLTFTPSTLGAETAQITFTDDAASNPQVLTVTGTGVNAATSVTVAPTNLSFGNQTVGTISSSQSVTITNTGTAVLNITQITVGGDFNQTNTCGATLNVLNVGASCVVNITFNPTASGARNGSLSIADNATGSPQNVALAGTGVAVFTVGATSTTTTVVIGSTTATFTVNASAPSSFTGNISFTCSAGLTCAFSTSPIFAGQSTTLTLSSLTTTMANPLNFTVYGTSGSQTASVALTLLFSDYTLSATPGLNTIASGSPANYTIVVTPSFGLNQRVDLSCSNLPVGATCTFDNASVTPNGSPVNAALTINTIKNVASLPPHRWPLGGAPPPRALGIAMLGLLGSLLLLRRRTRSDATSAGLNPMRARLVALAVSLLVLALLLGACRPANTTSGGTLTGNYTITITGTLNSNTAVTRTTTLNLSVT